MDIPAKKEIYASVGFRTLIVQALSQPRLTVLSMLSSGIEVFQCV
jgi:hypothetical protein